MKSYLNLCSCHMYEPVSISPKNLLRYIVYLAITHRPCSVRQYFSVIRLLQLESGLANPLENNWAVKMLLSGIKCIGGDFVNQKLPITKCILQNMYSVLDLSVSQNCTFWATCLIAFYGMLRKFSLFPSNPRQNLLLQHCAVKLWGIVLTLNYSKTIQYQEREVYVALPWNPDEHLCPDRHIFKSAHRAGCSSGANFLFSFTLKGSFLKKGRGYPSTQLWGPSRHHKSPRGLEVLSLPALFKYRSIRSCRTY